MSKPTCDSGLAADIDRAQYLLGQVRGHPGCKSTISKRYKKHILPHVKEEISALSEYAGLQYLKGYRNAIRSVAALDDNTQLALLLEKLMADNLNSSFPRIGRLVDEAITRKRESLNIKLREGLLAAIVATEEGVAYQKEFTALLYSKDLRLTCNFRLQELHAYLREEYELIVCDCGYRKVYLFHRRYTVNRDINTIIAGETIQGLLFEVSADRFPQKGYDELDKALQLHDCPIPARILLQMLLQIKIF
jgi:hypothetical protein